MRFRLKMMLSMVCLVALLFGIGGSSLIALSFESSLEREKQSAKESYQMILDTIAVVGAMDIWKSAQDVSTMIDNMYAESLSPWSALRLSTSKTTLQERGSGASLLTADHEIVSTESSVISPLSDNEGGHYLMISGAFAVDDETYYLDTLQDISDLYSLRTQQQDAYRIIFIVLLVLCAIAAYIISHLLTRPLSRLARASREIASGNLSFRSRVKTNDEIGALSTDFDTMADQVEKSLTSLRSSVEQRERFMGSFAHELKTPMTAIIGYADLLRSNRLDPEEQAEAARYIFSEGIRLENLSLKLLDIFVLDRQEIDLQTASPADISHDIVELLRPTLETDGIAIEESYERGDCYLEPDLFRSLLLNLIDNARKAIEHTGTIRIDIAMIDQGCRIQVTDTGKGIPPASLQHLAEAFYRADTSRSRKDGGAGLGLTLCAKIAELHRGTLHVESRLGEGTCMIVHLQGGRR